MTLYHDPTPNLSAMQIVLRAQTRDGRCVDVVVHDALPGIVDVEDAYCFAHLDAAANLGGGPPSAQALDAHLGQRLLACLTAHLREPELPRVMGVWEGALSRVLRLIWRPQAEPTDAPAIPGTGIEAVTAVDQAGDHEVLSDG